MLFGTSNANLQDCVSGAGEPTPEGAFRIRSMTQCVSVIFEIACPTWLVGIGMRHGNMARRTYCGFQQLFAC